MYLLLKASKINLKNHPIIKRLFQYRQHLSQMDGVYEEVIKPQLEMLISIQVGYMLTFQNLFINFNTLRYCFPLFFCIFTFSSYAISIKLIFYRFLGFIQIILSKSGGLDVVIKKHFSLIQKF